MTVMYKVMLVAAALAAGPASAQGNAASPAKACEPRALPFDKDAGLWKHAPFSALKRDTVYTLLQEDGRTVDFILRGGDVEVRKSVCFPVMLDADVFKDGTEYRQGDCVTYGGQLFVARRSTTGTPLRSPDWRLAVKKGRDAREAREVA